MALLSGFRIWETTTSTGTGTLSLAGAVQQCQGIASAIGTGNTMLYWLLDGNNTAWECGIGTVTSGTPDTFSRDTVLASSSSGAKIALSSNTHNIYNGEVPGYVAVANFLDTTLQRPELKDVAETVASPTISAGALTVDFEAGNVKTISHDANITSITISNPPASGKAGSMTIIFTQDATGGRTIAGWPAAVKWSGGTAPAFSTTASKTNVVTLITTDGGTTYFGWLAGKDFV